MPRAAKPSPKKSLKRVIDKKGFGQRVAARREDLGLTQDDLGRLVGMSQQGIASIERGEVERPRVIDEISKALKVQKNWLLYNEGIIPSMPDHTEGDFDPHSAPAGSIQVVGEVAAGRYVEFMNDVRIDFEPRPSEFPPVPGYPPNSQFDLRVSGTSINKLAQDGDFLRCVNLMIHPVDVMNDDIVIFERLKDGGQLREVTAKRIRHTGKKTELLPYSTDPQWQTPTLLPYGEFEGEEGRIIALVLYAFRPTRGPK